MKQWKLAISPLACSILFAFVIINFTGIQFTSIQGALIPVLGLISVLAGLAFYKKGLITGDDMK
jgi:hypothetical protein